MASQTLDAILERRLQACATIAAEWGSGYAALVAASIIVARFDMAHGKRGNPLNDPGAARAWMHSTGKNWLELIGCDEERARAILGDGREQWEGVPGIRMKRKMRSVSNG